MMETMIGSSQMMNPRASVVIPTFLKTAYLELTLASYVRQTYTNFELVVVSDGFSEENDRVIAKYENRLDIKYVRQSNRGRAAARNTGLSVANGDIIIFSDDDRVVSPGFIDAHAQAIARPNDGRYVIGVQKALLTLWRDGVQDDPRVRQVFASRPELIEEIQSARAGVLVSADDVEHRLPDVVERFSADEPWWDEYCGKVLRAFPNGLDAFQLAWFLGTTGNMSVGRTQLETIGGFDEGFSGWGMEDTDLCYRLSQSRAHAVICHEAVNYHQIHARSAAAFAEAKRNVQRFADKYRNLDACLFRLWLSGSDPVILNNLSIESKELCKTRDSHLVQQFVSLYEGLERANSSRCGGDSHARQG